ncbi:hypothetical protein GP486_007507 [Trichoglossum hirsutum]|uniref:Uncharacterized protein n=1 Tax=Trichoglossum hirsutum TaxID=265104 RepID=A0A9P8L6T9_9PEZI|nr:hypothetical protein GP486_007507 [Trichoglossum hirsutum]
MAKVDAFVEEINWPARDLSLLRLGAILAKHPRAYLTIPEPDQPGEPGREYIGDIIERDRETYGRDVYGDLRPIDPDEVEHIENERFHRWRQPRALYYTILNYFWGRRGTIFVAAAFCLLTVIGSGCSRTWQQLLACRLLLGLGMGAKATTVPIFAAESAPAQIRGALGTRSPRWYMKKGEYMKAYESLCRLRNSHLQAARDLFYVRQQLLNEVDGLGKDTRYFNRAMSLFTRDRVRRATLAAFVVMIAQQLCGSE